MFAYIEAAGWPIWPLLLASVIALAIIGERAWSLRTGAVAPKNLLEQVIEDYRHGAINPQTLTQLAQGSPLGQIFATGLRNSRSSPLVMKEALEDTGRAVTYELERFLTTLGTIASISPLLGLLGTVIGMIEIFGSQTPSGGNPIILAHGISVALYNTAFGLSIAVVCMIAHVFLHTRGKNIQHDLESTTERVFNLLTVSSKSGY